MKAAEREPVTLVGRVSYTLANIQCLRLYPSSGTVDENTHVCLLAAA